MLPNPKDEHLNPKIIGSMLLAISFGFLILGSVYLVSITNTYFLNGNTTTGLVQSVERNQWPRFKTYTYTLEYTDLQNKPIISNTTAAAGIYPGSTVDLIYNKNNPQQVYFSNSYLASISYYLGIISLGLFIGLFGLSRFFSKKTLPTKTKHQTERIKNESLSATNDSSPDHEKHTYPRSIKITQNIMIILLLICIVGYLAGGK